MATDFTPPPCRVLMAGGQWLVPPEQRPVIHAPVLPPPAPAPAPVDPRLCQRCHIAPKVGYKYCAECREARKKEYNRDYCGSQVRFGSPEWRASIAEGARKRWANVPVEQRREFMAGLRRRKV